MAGCQVKITINQVMMASIKNKSQPKNMILFDCLIYETSDLPKISPIRYQKDILNLKPDLNGDLF